MRRIWEIKVLLGDQAARVHGLKQAYQGYSERLWRLVLDRIVQSDRSPVAIQRYRVNGQWLYLAYQQPRSSLQSVS